MRGLSLLSTVLIAASFFVTSCEPPAANNANRPANAANTNTASSSTANHEADVKKLMGDLAAVLQSNNADAAARFYSEDYQLITPNGTVQNKAERLADMRSGNTKFDEFSYNDITVRSYGDMAVAVSRVKTKGKIQGQMQDRELTATLVLRKGPEGWKVVSGQATPVTAAATTTTAANTANANKPAAANTTANANRY